MTIYERLYKIYGTYINNAIACAESGLESSSNIISAQADILYEFIGNMPIEIADMYAGENE